MITFNRKIYEEIIQETGINGDSRYYNFLMGEIGNKNFKNRREIKEFIVKYWNLYQEKLSRYKEIANYKMNTKICNMTNASRSANLGLSVGGAKNIKNFRENIKNGYRPKLSSITYEGIFNEYYFQTDYKQNKDDLVSPAYNYAVSFNPLTDEKEYYLSLGLSSNIKINDYKRDKLNLLLLIDISGSMSAQIDDYYYDGKTKTENPISKMQLTGDVLSSVIKRLNDEDYLGIAYFNGDSSIGLESTKVGDIDIEKSVEKLKRLEANGGTNFSAGLDKINLMYDNQNINRGDYNNRLIIISDYMPNIGELGGLDGYLKTFSDKKLYSTFIGIGVDSNTDLMEDISKIRGANYLTVNSKDKFKKKMVDEFNYLVNPVAFNIKLSLESNGFELKEIYGSPESDISTSECLKINTLFPSITEEGKTKGGIILAKLKKVDNKKNNIDLKLKYRDKAEEKHSSKISIKIEDKKNNFYPDNSIRKAVLLIRYISILRRWLKNETSGKTTVKLPDEGDNRTQQRSRWESSSTRLEIKVEFKELFMDFYAHFKNESEIIKDDTLKKEEEVLKYLATYNSN